MDEAYRTPDYAYPIQRFKSEYDDFKEFMVGMFIWAVIALVAFAVFYGVYVWLG
jgi:hypothetical protein